jgi:multidrug efflux pump subunit AcrB
MAALVVVGILLVWMFDSILLAAIVMAAVPFAFIGAVSGLLATGHAFGFMSFLGLIALIGVFVNHKIYFVDRMRELRDRGHDLASAVTQAGNDRIRPVVLTALTAILGLLPLTLGGGTVWASFGWVNIFGLLASIPLSLVLLPAMIVGALRLLGRDRAIAPPAQPSSRRNVPSIIDPMTNPDVTLPYRAPPAPRDYSDLS